MVCENYTPTSPDETAFASKEYLSKALLEYVLKLELLPPICNMCEQTECTQARPQQSDLL